jgi:hypothetical protein
MRNEHGAEEELRRAIALGEAARRGSGSAEFRQTISAAMARAYEQLIFMASVVMTETDAAGRATERATNPLAVLDLAQRLAARNLSGALHLSQAVGRAASDELVASMLRLRAAEVAVEEAAQDGSQDLQPHLRQLSRASDDFAAVARRHGIDVGERDNTFTVAEVRSSLEPGECLVELIPLNDAVAILCVDSGGGVTVGCAPLEREERVALLRRLARVRRHAAVDDLVSTLGGYGERLAALSAELEDRLFRRVRLELRDHPPARRLLVVTHNELTQVPYWQLADEATDRIVSVLPAVSTLVELRRSSDRMPGGRPSVVVGDVSGTLTYAKGEVASIGAFAECDPASLRDRLNDCGRAHFAGHGYFDSEHPYRSGVVVASGTGERPGVPVISTSGTADTFDLELLSVAEIIGKLHMPYCELVVLSACDTGLSRLHPASEFTSLPGAFLVAGARNVIASLWPAHDGAAALLMSALYEALADGGGNAPARALSMARDRLAALCHDEVVSRLGNDRFVPEREFPFASALYLDTFQHYGAD